MESLYHCTQRKNLKHILEKGLLPNKPDLIRKSIEGVYLSKHPFDWMHYTTNQTQIAGAMIEVDVTGYDLIKDNGIVDDGYTWDNHPAYVYPGKIPVDRFISINVSTDEKPYEFEKYSKEDFHRLIDGKPLIALKEKYDEKKADIKKGEKCPFCGSFKIRKVLYAFVCDDCNKEFYEKEIFDKLKLSPGSISDKYIKRRR